MEVPMVNRLPLSYQALVNQKHARQVLGALGLLIALCGNRSCLGIILQQARSEIASLLRSDEEARRQDETAAA
jgi:hypothetical protein